MLNIDWHDILPLLYFDEIDYDSLNINFFF